MDQFGSKIELTMRGSSTYKTKLGGVVSLLCGMGLFGYLVY